LTAAFVRIYAQKMTARICPVELIVMCRGAQPITHPRPPPELKMALLGEVFLSGNDHESKAIEIGCPLDPSSSPQVISRQ